MGQQLHIYRRRERKSPMQVRRVGAAFEAPAAGAAAAAGAAEFPGLGNYDSDDDSKRTAITASVATLLHGGVVAVLVLAASLAPVIDEDLIPVQLIREEPPPPDEPAPAPKVLAERRALPYAPAIQSVAPQIVNPRVVADAVPRIEADALDMDAVSSSAAPTDIQRRSLAVERVSAVNSIVSARVAAVDVGQVGAPVVRGPVKIDAPAGPSAGPRQVAVAKTGPSMGTGTLEIGGGSSVRDGVLSTRDVLGSPDGPRLVRIDTAIGEGASRGTGGTGTSTVSSEACFARPEVQSYMGQIQQRTLERWALPPGLNADQRVTLRFRLDAAGSANSVKLVRASDNALGASAVDALASASPFPPMPEPARCLSRVPIIATFTNPRAG